MTAVAVPVLALLAPPAVSAQGWARESDRREGVTCDSEIRSRTEAWAEARLLSEWWEKVYIVSLVGICRYFV